MLRHRFRLIFAIKIPQSIHIVWLSFFLFQAANANTQQDDGVRHLTLIDDLYRAISIHGSLKNAFSRGISIRDFYQFSENLGLVDARIDHLSDINFFKSAAFVHDTFYAVKITEKGGASISLAFNFGNNDVDANWDSKFVRVNAGSLYIRLSDFDMDFIVNSFGGELQISGYDSEIHFPYSALHASVLAQGFNYVLSGEIITIDEIGLRVTGLRYVIGTPYDDTFFLKNTDNSYVVVVSGGEGENSLVGPSAINYWEVEGARSVVINTIRFNGFSILVGGGVKDTFALGDLSDAEFKTLDIRAGKGACFIGVLGDESRC